MTEARRCPKCREMTMRRISELPTTSLTPPLVDLDDYEVWECDHCPDDSPDVPLDARWRYRVEMKRDGTATRDARYTLPIVAPLVVVPNWARRVDEPVR